jgi:hypothetical protein
VEINQFVLDEVSEKVLQQCEIGFFVRIHRGSYGQADQVLPMLHRKREKATVRMTAYKHETQ